MMRSHLSDDRLIELCMLDAPAPGEQQHLSPACAATRAACASSGSSTTSRIRRRQPPMRRFRPSV